MKAKIVSDGSPIGTRFEVEGHDFSGNVSAVTWQHNAGDLPIIRATMGLIPIEVEGELHMETPDGREIRRIVYVDGSVDEFRRDTTER